MFLLKKSFERMLCNEITVPLTNGGKTKVSDFSDELIITTGVKLLFAGIFVESVIVPSIVIVKFSLSYVNVA